MYNFLYRIANEVGIAGVILTLIAYYLLSTGHWGSNTLKYQGSNFIGAVMILFSVLFYWNLASAVMEISWMAISLIGIYRIWAH